MVKSNQLPSPAAGGALARLAQQLSADPTFMSSLLHKFQVQERLDTDSLAKHLRLSPESLTRLALCKRPQSDQPEFTAQVHQIADYAGLNSATLARLIRQVEAVEAAKELGTGSDTTAAEESAPRQSSQMRPGWLAAARDRAEDEEGQQSDQEGPSGQETDE